MPAPKDPEKYKLYIKRLKESHLGQKSWNKGLTKDTDRRVRRISESEKGRVNIGKHNSLETEIKKGQHLSPSTEFKKGSQGHKGFHHNEKTKEKLREYHANKRMKAKCDYCGREILLISYRLKNHKHHFCSWSCQRQFYSGKNNNKWKGGITPENLLVRHSIEYRLWREAVFARDNWTCQKCKIKGGQLIAHHKKSFAEYPELRFAINNGITLCERCHNKIHGRIIIYRDSKGRFTKKDFLSSEESLSLY